MAKKEKFICPFCKKEFKTALNLSNHYCDKKKRYTGLDNMAFNMWVYWCKKLYIKLPADDDEKRIKFVTSPEYKHIMSLYYYLTDRGSIIKYQYIDWLTSNKIKVKNWCNDDIYLTALTSFLHNENKIIAKKRSEQYIENMNIDFDNISENDFYLILISGNISPWYFKDNIKPLKILGDDLLTRIYPLMKVIL